MILKIGKVIYSLLTGNKQVTDKVQKKVYPLVADNETSYPFIVYKRNSVIPSNTKDRFAYQEEAILDVVIVSDKYNTSLDIAEIVKDALNNKRGFIEGINVRTMYLIDAEEDFINDAFTQKLTFKIIIQNGK